MMTGLALLVWVPSAYHVHISISMHVLDNHAYIYMDTSMHIPNNHVMIDQCEQGS